MPCAIGCGGDRGKKYVWTSADGSQTMEYTKEIVVKAKVQRKGGSYTTVQKG